MNEPVNRRILLVDDNPAIHEDFRNILNASNRRNETIEHAELLLLGVAVMTVDADAFQLESAMQGREALENVAAALKEKRPYAMAFVDVRMPPGWDGIETIEHLWKIDPALQVVLCTAYSDYSWEKLAARLGINDKLIILKKPFDNIEVLHLAHALTSKWNSAHEVQRHVEELDRRVAQRTLHLRAANDELRRSEERFGKAFNASPVGLAIQTLDDSTFIDVNEAFAEMAGVPRDDLIGQNPLEVGLRLDFPQAILDDIRAGRPVHNAETQVGTRDGKTRQALVSFERITLGGEPHVLLLAQDISERLRLEAQLHQSQKMEAVGQLAAGIAHDFNNVLTIIEGHASLQLGMP
ncbi:MAG: PAS domain S-box protein [Chthoniobacteraceae bacterium]